MPESKGVTLDDVAGLEYQKSILYDSLILPRKKRNVYSSLIKRPEMVRDRNVFLFHGPPGTGKTLLAKAIANEIDIPYKEIPSTYFINKYRGKGAEDLRTIYDWNGEWLFFIDEIDAITKNRNADSMNNNDDLLMQLLMNIDGPGSHDDKITIMSTNRYDILDEALISRVPEQYRLKFDKPDINQRYRIIEQHLSYYNHRIDDINELVSLAVDKDGREIALMFKPACTNALKKDRTYLTIQDFQTNVEYNKELMTGYQHAS
ncbi:MAG: AAA family ATPase [Nanobdellota archaeon]